MTETTEGSSIVVRREQISDHATVWQLTRAAFAASAYGDHGEADLIDRLRVDCPGILSLVAEQASQVVGHILFSPVQLIATETTIEGMGLGPMAVLPDEQRQGIGTELVRAGLQHVRQLGCPFVVVLGDPAFYGRCGFRPAVDREIVCEFPGIPAEAFQLVIFDGETSDLPSGTIRYRSEFSELE